MKFVIMTLALLIACGDKDGDTAEEVDSAEVSEVLEGSEGEGEMSGDECVDGDTQVVEDVSYICEDGIWVELTSEEDPEE